MEAKKLGLFIAKLRKEKQITQTELAKQLNVTDKAVSRWERGLGFPDINTLEPLADALGISLSELMKCAKKSETDENVEDLDIGILASIDIAKTQRKKIIKKILLGFSCCVISLCVVLYAVYLFISGRWTFMLGGNDNSTAIFISGKIGVLPPTIIIIVGVVVLLVGIYILIHSLNNDKFHF